MVNKNLDACKSICGLHVMLECDIERGNKTLADDCEAACESSGDYSPGNAALLATRLVESNGCYRYFEPANDTKRVIFDEFPLTAQEAIAIGVVAVGVLFFLSVCPVPLLAL